MGLHLAERFCEVIAIEINKDAVRRGEADRERLGVSHLRFHRGDSRELYTFTPADLVAVDPPRSGLSAEVIQAIVQARPKRVLYLSCDPATWARDVRGLTQAGYRLAFARPYDFYPFTHHVEVLSLLER